MVDSAQEFLTKDIHIVLLYSSYERHYLSIKVLCYNSKLDAIRYYYPIYIWFNP